MFQAFLGILFVKALVGDSSLQRLPTIARKLVEEFDGVVIASMGGHTVDAALIALARVNGGMTRKNLPSLTALRIPGMGSVNFMMSEDGSSVKLVVRSVDSDGDPYRLDGYLGSAGTDNVLGDISDSEYIIGLAPNLEVLTGSVLAVVATAYRASEEVEGGNAVQLYSRTETVTVDGQKIKRAIYNALGLTLIIIPPEKANEYWPLPVVALRDSGEVDIPTIPTVVVDKSRSIVGNIAVRVRRARKGAANLTS